MDMEFVDNEVLKIKDEKINLHFVSSTVGSIYEITSDLVKEFENIFNVTKEWEGEIPTTNDILLVHFYDEKIIEHKSFNSFKKKILIQPIDGTSLKKEVIQNMNKFDLIICPAEASKCILIMNGVTVPIEIIPNYYKSDLFEKSICTNITKYVPTDKIIFYHESTLHPRKGIEILYEGFIRAFSDNEINEESYADKVVLIIKDQPYNLLTFKQIEKLKRQAIKLQKKYKKPVPIIKFSSELSFDELKDLWVSANIYVSMAKIEGFGIPMLRMFLMGKPVICLDNPNSGYMDYLSDNNAYLIPTIQHKAKDEFMSLYNEKTKWAVPSMNSVIETFRKCLIEYERGVYKHIKNTLVSDAFSISYKDQTKLYMEKYFFPNVIKKYIDTIEKFYNFNN